MNGRGRDGGYSRAAAPKKKVIEIVSRAVAVKDEPERYAETVCQLQKGVYLTVTDEKTIEGVVWMEVGFGWLSGVDNMGYEAFIVSSEVSANKAWAQEYDNRRRIAGAVAAMLTRAHAIHNAQRVARSIFKYVNRPVGVKLVNLPDVSTEDLMVGLTMAQGLRQAEVLEFLKIAASQQCNPPKALKDMAAEVNDLMNMRPTLWVKEERNVLETVDVKLRNDQFVMAAARGDVKTMDKFMAMGQELTALHSELKYTALHAASDFGHPEIVKKLIRTGISVNIRDAKRGQTPLHFGGQGGRPEILQMLLEAGADRTITSYKGQLPFQLADEQGNFECREILKHTPPAVQYVTVTKVTTTSVTISWDAPIIHEAQHSRVTDYVVEWIPVGQSSEVGNGDRFYTAKQEYRVNNLRPSSGHGFAIYSRSLAGWSQPSSKLIQFTLPAQPDAPPPPEMLRLSTNAIYLAWHPPAHDNGAKVDMYQLELIDCDMGKEQDQREEAERQRVLMARAALKAARKRRAMSLNGNGDDNESAVTAEEDDFEDEEDDQFEVKAAEFDHTANIVEEDGAAEMSVAFSVDANTSAATSIVDAGTVAKPPLKAGSMNMLHRIFKHKQVLNRRKQCMGLEPFRAYQCRVRCHNELGYSVWSEWIGPIVPQPGVYVLEFNREERSARVGWFRPILSNGRKVQCFEAQLAKLDGPVSREISVYGEVHPLEKASPLEYTTLNSALTTNELILNDLQAGSRYVVRVRYQVNDGVWSDWAVAFSSDPILVPACAPECPFHLRPALKPQKDLTSLVLSTAEPEEDAFNESFDRGSTIDKAGVVLEEQSLQTKSSAVQVDEDGEAIHEVKHNEIIIQWTNGVTNGSPVLEVKVEMAKLRDYTQADMDGAFAAAYDPDHFPLDGGESVASFGATETHAKKGKKKRRGSASDSGSEDDAPANQSAPVPAAVSDASKVSGQSANAALAEQLKWRDVTRDGEMMGPAAFRMPGLIPGSSYVFRAKVRNEYGWSPTSAASPIIATFPCTPPGQPEALDVSSNFFYLRWNESDGDALGLTNLEFDVQIGKIPLGERARANTLLWLKADTRAAAHLCKKPFVGIMVDKLGSSTVYACRVRVRTIAGWSAWSDISNPIRTTTL